MSGVGEPLVWCEGLIGGSTVEVEFEIGIGFILDFGSPRLETLRLGFRLSLRLSFRLSLDWGRSSLCER